ncbi:MAG TPA: Spy/CpxP family protein refolding chaperone [Candidatus Solibacter sp.]|jgi:Spy/CpxP family protein refolding chaperone
MKWHLLQFAAVTALATGMVLAQAPGAMPKAPYAHPMFGHGQMMEALNLTPAQKQQADAIFNDAKQKAGPLREEMRQNREALHAAVKANNTSQIEKLSTQQGELHGKALAIRSGAMAKFYTILTPEQRTKADDMMTRMRQRMEERMRGRESENPE